MYYYYFVLHHPGKISVLGSCLHLPQDAVIASLYIQFCIHIASVFQPFCHSGALERFYYYSVLSGTTLWMRPTLNLATIFLMLRIDSYKLNKLMDCWWMSLLYWRMSAVTFWHLEFAKFGWTFNLKLHVYYTVGTAIYKGSLYGNLYVIPIYYVESGI